ncbi:TetR/AcrR family transcriptional regulator [Streptomyces griseofuscus]|uniref:TetR/AcrR family transcriptional regulator n=2 Tax=Streptomyces TaxID=1883 RepID=UPI0034517C90
MQTRVGRGAAKEQWVDGGEYTRDQHRSAGAAPGGEPQGRPRDARETRARILRAAGAVFAERGYEAATVRDIAARAGVNQALIFRYFGSKQALLTEVMAQDGKEQVSSTPPELLFETALRGVLAEGGGPDADRLAVYLRSIGGADAAPETVRALGEEYAAALAALSEAEDGTLRAQLAMAWLLGIGLMRVVVRQEPLATADPDAICTHVLTALDRLLPVLPGAEPRPGAEREPGADSGPGAGEERPGVRP